MNAIRALIRRLASQTEGATMVEYALILFLVTLICVSVVSYIGSSLVLPMFQLSGF